MFQGRVIRIAVLIASRFQIWVLDTFPTRKGDTGKAVKRAWAQSPSPRPAGWEGAPQEEEEKGEGQVRRGKTPRGSALALAPDCSLTLSVYPGMSRLHSFKIPLRAVIFKAEEILGHTAVQVSV